MTLNERRKRLAKAGAMEAVVTAKGPDGVVREIKRTLEPSLPRLMQGFEDLRRRGFRIVGVRRVAA